MGYYWATRVHRRVQVVGEQCMPAIQPSTDGSVEPSPLLERADHLAALDAYLATVLQGAGGRMVFVGGEAGVGKSVLVRRFCGACANSARVFTGACDPLLTPRPLGPFVDIAPRVSGQFQALAECGGRPYEIAAALMRALAAGPPTILLIEDAHWADEATLDVLRFLARRIEAIPALILVTYRDELERIHPLRILLGDLPPDETIIRMRLAPLSLRAVAELAEPRGVDAADLFRKTAGNPFFVTEALADGEIAIPPTVRDAVLARAARLPTGAVELLEAVAIVPLPTELWLLEQLAGDVLDHLDACLSSGILATADGAIRFRHELARLAIEDTLTPIRRIALHRHALQALETPPTGTPDLARLAHHAEAAADDDAMLRWASAAAARAAALGAHREAAAHYARALRVAGDLQPLARGEMFARHANECFLADQFPTTVASGREAVKCFRAAGDHLREGNTLRELSYHLRCTGYSEEAQAAGMQALSLLEREPAGRELALAYANAAYLALNADDADNAAAFGQRAYALAQQVDDTESQVHVLNTLGTLELLVGEPEGVAKLQRSLESAHAAGMQEQVGRAFVNYCWAATRSRFYADFERMFTSGIEYCNERGLILWRHYVLAYGARCALDQGRWSAASDLAQRVLRDPRTSLPRVCALVALALIRARRGDPECWPLLDEALALAEPTGELQHIAPVVAARAEVAWLEGRPAVVMEATNAALTLALQRRAAWVIGELACWRWRAGMQAPRDGAAEPYAQEIGGHWEVAARYWEQRGCPYEAALARAGADDEQALRDALAALLSLGAAATARIVARRLRELGVRDLPRGPRASTRSNSAHLTARELEVLELIVQGLRNADIATHLYLSPKTVDHHISAILAKLHVHSRAEAIAYGLSQSLVHADASPKAPRQALPTV
jgi:DNA-binding CsgD family transcriptional regulator/tetratricopeptide (TPR) repeat protein